MAAKTKSVKFPLGGKVSFTKQGKGGSKMPAAKGAPKPSDGKGIKAPKKQVYEQDESEETGGM